jgi:hypothetical protein
MKSLLVILVIMVSDTVLTGGFGVSGINKMCAQTVSDTMFTATNGVSYTLPATSNYDSVYIFWSVDCPVCRSMVTYVNALHTSFSKNTSIVAVVPPELWDDAEVKDFVDTYHPLFPLQVDTSYALQRRFNATIMPEAIVVHKGEKVYQGRINDLYARIGRRRAKVVHNDVDDVLQELSNSVVPAYRYTEPVGCRLNVPK